MSTFQILALLGIFLIFFGLLALAWEMVRSTRELRRVNHLLKDLLTVMRDRL